MATATNSSHGVAMKRNDKRLAISGTKQRIKARLPPIRSVTPPTVKRPALLAAPITGLLPDLFREGQGVVVEGVLLESGIFQADQVLAKHDENYMPAEVAEALKRNGQWRGEEDPSFP